MSQPSKESAAPAVKVKRGCLPALVKGLVILVVVGAVAGIFLWQRNQATKRANREESVLTELSQQPQELALEAVQSNDEVTAALGEPVALQGKRGSIRRAQATGQLDRSNAQFSFDIAGSKDKGTVDAVARQADGNWQVTQIKVTLAGGKTIDVPPPSADAAPKIDFDVP